MRRTVSLTQVGFRLVPLLRLAETPDLRSVCLTGWTLRFKGRVR